MNAIAAVAIAWGVLWLVLFPMGAALIFRNADMAIGMAAMAMFLSPLVWRVR